MEKRWKPDQGRKCESRLMLGVCFVAGPPAKLHMPGAGCFSNSVIGEEASLANPVRSQINDEAFGEGRASGKVHLLSWRAFCRGAINPRPLSANSGAPLLLPGPRTEFQPNCLKKKPRILTISHSLRTNAFFFSACVIIDDCENLGCCSIQCRRYQAIQGLA